MAQTAELSRHQAELRGIASALLAGMFAHVLVATDFTQGAAAALDRAFRLPLTSEARIEVVHVLPHDADGSAVDMAAEALTREVERARASASVRPPCTTSCLRGTPFVEIIRAARARNVELVVIGAHGRRPFREMLVGSTASRVMRSGDTPVLLVRQPANAPYRDVLVALSLCDTDFRLIELAKKMSASRRSAVHAVHVPFEGFMAPTAAARENVRAAFCTEAATKLRATLAEADPGGVWEATVVAGDRRTAILDRARTRGVDLVIAGTHARSGIAYALIGSVAETLITSAPTDVLIARPDRFAFELP